MGTIKIDECYPAETFKQIAAISDKSLRHAERDGLEPSWVGRKKYFTGKAWFDYLESKRGQEAPNCGQKAVTA